MFQQNQQQQMQQQQQHGFDQQLMQPSAPPMDAQWLPPPTEIPFGCSPGMEFLVMVDGFIVEQEVAHFGSVQSRFRVKNKNGAQVYFAQEDSECCERACHKNRRGYVMTMTDNSGRVAIKYTRIRPGSQSCCDHTEKVDCHDANGNSIGLIRQVEPKCCDEMTLKLNDVNMNTQLYIRFKPECCERPKFRVYGIDNQTLIGTIEKKRGNILREMFTNADTYGVDFPLDLDVNAKALILGALFLIDMMYFEESNE